MVAPDIQLTLTARALGAMLEDGDQELILKAAAERLKGHCLLQMGNWESQQPIRRSRLCERLEHRTAAIRAIRVIKNLPVCALIQGLSFGQLWTAGLALCCEQNGDPRRAPHRNLGQGRSSQPIG
eukprot:jgi/Botrbrau1/2007/Bobra.0052s0047.1